MDARDSAIASLQHKLNFQKMEATKYGKQVIKLEEKLTSTEQELESTKQTLEEKTTALTQARKHLKNSRERTMVCTAGAVTTVGQLLHPLLSPLMPLLNVKSIILCSMNNTLCVYCFVLCSTES